nr:hypothetical protein CFP56_32824 [Quercus suber]
MMAYVRFANRRKTQWYMHCGVVLGLKACGVYKINFDGAIFWTQHSAGIGVIAKDFSGLPIVVLSGKTCGVEVEEE